MGDAGHVRGEIVKVAAGTFRPAGRPRHCAVFGSGAVDGNAVTTCGGGHPERAARSLYSVQRPQQSAGPGAP